MNNQSQASEILFLVSDLEKLKYWTWRLSVSGLAFSSGTEKKTKNPVQVSVCSINVESYVKAIFKSFGLGKRKMTVNILLFIYILYIFYISIICLPVCMYLFNLPKYRSSTESMMIIYNHQKSLWFTLIVC